MKVLMINGSPNEKGCTYTALSEVAAELKRLGIDSEILWLGKKPMQDCIACNRCRSLKRCIFNDLVNETADRLPEFSGLVVGSPVYYGGSTGIIRSFLNRLFYSRLDEVKLNASVLNGMPAAAVVSCRRGGASMAFAQLNMYFERQRMTQVCSQYWNQVHGHTPEEVKTDAEGMQTMRTLAQNMAWLIKSVRLADDNGLKRPKYEDFQPTNFIR